MDKILTISVAAYKVEKYLRQCLDSFLIPEAEECLEVLVINDGSGEGINEIARQYEQSYPGVFRLIDKENGGHGSTVNRGIEEAAGTYFKTVDGDDFVQKEGLQQLLDFLRNTRADLVVTDYQCFDDASGQVTDENRNGLAGKEYLRVYEWEEVCGQVYINMHASTYRTERLREMARRLDEHCFYVDAEYILYPVPYIKTVAFLEHPVYMYRLGMTTQSMNIRNMQKNCEHDERVLRHLLDFYSECQSGISEGKRRYIARGIARILVSQIKIYLSFPAGQKWKEKIQSLDRRMKEEYPEVYGNVSNRSVKLLRLSGYHLYRVACAACRKAYHCEEGEGQ